MFFGPSFIHAKQAEGEDIYQNEEYGDQSSHVKDVKASGLSVM